jgi:hypothetical protein
MRSVVSPSLAKLGKMLAVMKCPRCTSLRIQLGYKDKSLLARLAGGDEFLCNNCGLEFKSFDLSGKVKRKPSTGQESSANRRRAPRYKAHLPATVSLADKDAFSGKLVRSKESRARCETISRLGLALSFTGSKFDAKELAKPGRLLFVTVTLPNGAINAVVATVSHDRIGAKEGTASWFVRTSITQISEGDSARLLTYLEKRGNEVPLFKRE